MLLYANELISVFAVFEILLILRLIGSKNISLPKLSPIIKSCKLSDDKIQFILQFIAVYLGIVLLIFVVLMLIDLIRKYLLERLLTRTTLFSKLCKWLNQFYGWSIKDEITQEKS